MKKCRIIVALSLFVLLIGCSQGTSDSETEIVQEKVNEVLGINPYIPQTDFPFGSLLIGYEMDTEEGEVTTGDPMQAEIIYYFSKDEPLDEEMKKAWGDERKELVYGDLYLDNTAIQMTISKGVVGELAGAESIEIDGHEVQYQVINEEMDVVVMGMDFDGYGYTIQYFLLEDETKEDAIAFAEEIINNNE
ncbi:hypothetical protein NSQ77_12525 [Oceanobacillus sp. FSL K6-2867]|uniref:hypothetical protein n=1 Tax=Oceanobacillus sp. FSL K6-2867 TaxID=2954748 RepID=UPI0030D8919F